MEEFNLVAKENLENLVTILETKLPRSAMVLSIIKLVTNGMLSDKVQTSVYTYGDFTQENNNSELFVVCIQTTTYYSFKIIETLVPENPTEEMLSAFESLVDWNFMNVYGVVPLDFAIHLEKMCNKNGKFSKEPTLLMYMNRSDALSVDLKYKDKMNNENEGVQTQKLKLEDAHLVESRWTFGKNEGALEHIEDSIQTLPTSGIYFESQLISNAVLSPWGRINSFFTQETHRQNGYGSLTMKFLAKQIVEFDIIPIVTVDKSNNDAKRLMEKIGFQVCYDSYWMCSKPAAAILEMGPRTKKPVGIVNHNYSARTYKKEGYESFADFYPFYLGEHCHQVNRRLHLVGTTNSVLITIIAIATGLYYLLPLALVQGYGMAWIGHFIFEKNKPATFKHPIYSLMGDFQMWWEVVTLKRPF